MSASSKNAVSSARVKTREGGAYAVLVGDVLQSTMYQDQRALFEGLQRQFDWVNEHIAATIVPKMATRSSFRSFMVLV